ncbi:MAG: D-alanyl-D-alanine carboxypeptidase family protein [Patescibacteria group bacterium]
MRWGYIGLWGLAGAVVLTGLLLFRSSNQPAADAIRASSSSVGISAPVVGDQPVLTDDPPPIYAQSAVVIDAGSGKVLISQDPHKSVPVASTTKVMSAIAFLLEGPNLDEQVTVSQAAASQIGSLMGLGAGERLTLYSLLAGAILMSGNDAIYQIAEHQGGVGTFVAKMNTIAATLGLKESNFRDPAGLDDEGRSSAYDLGMMFRYALTFDAFRSLIHASELTVESSTQSYRLVNSNRLVRGEEPLYLADALGGKTGFTPDAGHSLVAAAQRDGHVLIAVVLASDDTAPDGSAREARRLLNWTFDHTRWQ